MKAEEPVVNRPDTLPEVEEFMAKKLRAQRNHALIIAVASVFLSLGILTGMLVSRNQTQVRAVDKEVNSELSSAFVEIARQVEPSVVNISTVTLPQVKARATNEFPLPRPSFDSLPSDNIDPAKRGNGSGVIVDQSGYILTNHHVIQGADRIKIRLYDGNELPAKLVGSDRETDLAVIKVEAPYPLKPAKIGDSDKMRVGDWVLAIGSPFGLDQTVTAGIISARERDSSELYRRAGFQFFLQTDAAINRGNSGGPLINLIGEVVGINTAIATGTGDYNGISFALPSSEAISVYRQLVKQGRVIRGFLGALTERVTPQIARVYGLPIARGAIVSNVSETMEVNGSIVDSPAAKAGIKPNDIVLEFNGEKIKDDADLVRRVASSNVGSHAILKSFRDGTETTLTVNIGKRPGTQFVKDSPADAGFKSSDSVKNQNIGIRIETLTAQTIRDRELGSINGVLVLRVEPGSIADDAELKANDIIRMVNRRKITDKEDFKKALNDLNPGDPVVLQVYREKLIPVPHIFISFNKP